MTCVTPKALGDQEAGTLRFSGAVDQATILTEKDPGSKPNPIYHRDRCLHGSRRNLKTTSGGLLLGAAAYATILLVFFFISPF
jgi:hypothetical protein